MPRLDPKQPRLLVVDALRGLAALIVFFHHLRTLYPVLDAALARAAPTLHVLAVFLSRRNVEAVLLFFVLSGFSIGLTVERRGVADRSALLDYYARRAWRIVPLYVLSLVLSGVVGTWIAPVPAEALSLRTLLGNMLFLQTATGTAGQWFLPYAGNAALWSLSFEVFFYVGYPWLVRATLSRARRAHAVLALCAAGLLGGYFVPSPPMMFCAAALIWYFGVELAQLQRHGSMGLPVAAYAWLWLLSGALRFGLGWPSMHGLWVGAGCLLLGHAAMAADVSLGSFGKRGLQRTAAGLARVGAFSYALYLLHVPLVRGCVALLGQSVGSVACAVVLSLGVPRLAERAAGRLQRTG